MNTYGISNFEIPQSYLELPVFVGTDVGWMLLDFIAYYNELLNKYNQTKDDRYLEILEAILPKLKGEK
jgi:hypothetical protein